MKPLREMIKGKHVFCYNMTFMYTLKEFEDRKVLLNDKEYVICRPSDESAVLLTPPEMFRDITITRGING